jgi:hypothetical protein
MVIKKAETRNEYFSCSVGYDKSDEMYNKCTQNKKPLQALYLITNLQNIDTV